MKKIIKGLLAKTGLEIKRTSSSAVAKAVRKYRAGGSIPWSDGYSAARDQMIREVLSTPAMLEKFCASKALPERYGIGFDERCVEYPWLMARLGVNEEKMLDAGSTLNHSYILEQPQIEKRKLDILTLAPEGNCYWQRGISYLFSDLREIPIRDCNYDTVACLSVLEHVGCDNSTYGQAKSAYKDDPQDFKRVMKELRRVLKPGGSLFLTVPYGVYHHYGLFQQFDQKLLAQAIEAFGDATSSTATFYRYSASGWNVASQDECADSRFSEKIIKVWQGGERIKPHHGESDKCAAAQAVACLHLVKQ